MTTQQERKRILDAARATLSAKLDADVSGEGPDALAAWQQRRKRDDPDEPPPVPEPPPPPVDWSGWETWVQARIEAALERERAWQFEAVGEAVGELLNKESRRFELALAKLRTELCQQMTDTVVKIEGVVTADRIARGVEREAADRRAAGDSPKVN
jgi:hypothetical protein